MSERNKIILVMGAPRSGTTLITSILNSHPSIAITNETNIVRLIDVVDKSFFRKRSNSLTRSRSPRETWALDQAKTHIPQSESALYPMLRAYCTSIKPNNKVLLFGDKVPAYYTYNLDEFATKLDAELLIVFVTRNPVDVVSSMLRRSINAKQGLDTWTGPSTALSALNWWIDAWNQRRRIREISSVRFLDLNYDAAICDPAGLAALLSKFLNTDNLFSVDFINTAKIEKFIEASDLSKYMPQIIELEHTWPSMPLQLDEYHAYYPLGKDSIVRESYQAAKSKLKNIVKFICRIKSFSRSQ